MLVEPRKIKPEFAGDLIRIHSVITRALNVAIEKSRSFEDAGFLDASMKDGFLMYVRCLVELLDSHHLTEDKLAFPYLRKIFPDAPYDELMHQHRQMEPLVKESKTTIKYIEKSDRWEHLGSLYTPLSQIREIWSPHILKEEKHFGPTNIAGVIDMKERIRLGRLFAKHGVKHQHEGILMIPFILYNLSLKDRKIMSQMIPWIVRKISVQGLLKKRWQPMAPFLLK